MFYGVLAGVSVVACATAAALALKQLFDDMQTRRPCERFTDICSHRPQERSTGNLLLTVARWFAAPIATVAASWCFVLRPQGFLDNLPSLFRSYAAGLHKVLPLHPQNIQEAFDLGIAYEKLLGGHLAEALREAAKIAKRNVSEAELRRLPQLIQDLVKEEGGVARMLSIFNLVNVVWLVAIIGLTVTVGPFLYTISAPLRRLLLGLWTALLECLIATAKRCIPLYEPSMYALSFYLFVESTRYVLSREGGMDAYSTTGVMTAVSSVALFLLSWTYTTAKNSTGSGDFDLFMTITWSLAAMLIVPMAKVHQSTLLGYAATTAVVCALKFSAYSSGLCTVIGFRSYTDLARAALSCGTLTVINMAIKFLGVESEWIAPFQAPVGVLGTSIYLLSLDIHAFASRSTHSHLFYGINLAAIITAGELLNMHGMTNVAKTFAALLGFTMYCEVMPKNNKDWYIVWLFSLFALLYGGSLYLHRHPELVASVVAGGAS